MYLILTRDSPRTPSRRRGPLLDDDADLLMRGHEGIVSIGQIPCGAELLPGLELVRLPTRIVEIFVEDENRPRHDAIREPFENGFRGAVKIAIDMDQRDRPLRTKLREVFEAVLEPADHQAHIGRRHR